MDRRNLGNEAENLALEYLLERGLKLVCRNFRCKVGELDLVMLEGPTLVVIEVRSRQDQGFGTAVESIDWYKRKRLARATGYLLLMRAELRRLAVRFDVVTLNKTSAAGSGQIEWIRAAFDAGK